ncbi:MAG: hypothetical protein B0D92_07945 [Spirochaeta sp. LUC14_002_19_P3]|nr:MAG: hypothetical protein B0D92_07945 [Spirochaeta sp. LUC14_002_19_P3]
MFGDEIDSLLADVRQAVFDKRYTQAVSLLEEGKIRWPMDTRIARQAGDLYLNQKLYRLALAEYRRADELEPRNPEILHDIAKTHGYLGSNAAAVFVLENALAIAEPGDLRTSIIDDLSWMYFKTYRMDTGIALLESELSSQFNRGWAHTLGTLYSGIYNLEQARKWYLLSIGEAEISGDTAFAAVAYHNLSLLEITFYNYGEARKYAAKSLELQNRAGGHLIAGDLDMTAWNIPAALNSYQEAESIDNTPLSRISIADLYQRTGRLNEAIYFINKINAEADESWMYSWGTNSVHFGMSLSQILADAWKGKARTEALTPRWGRGARIRRFFTALAWRARGLYYDLHSRSLRTIHAAQLAAEGNILDSEFNAFLYSQGYRRAAVRHLEKARELETALTAASIPWYTMEAGIEEKNPRYLAKALETFQPEERNPAERTLRALAELSGRRGSGAALASLYKLNPGGLRQYGLSLPVRITSGSAGHKRRAARILKSAGYTVVKEPHPAAAVLTISIREDNIFWYLAKPDGQTISKTKTGRVSGKREMAPILAGLLDQFYTTPLSGADN